MPAGAYTAERNSEVKIQTWMVSTNEHGAYQYVAVEGESEHAAKAAVLKDPKAVLNRGRDWATFVWLLYKQYPGAEVIWNG